MTSNHRFPTEAEMWLSHWIYRPQGQPAGPDQEGRAALRRGGPALEVAASALFVIILACDHVAEFLVLFAVCIGVNGLRRLDRLHGHRFRSGSAAACVPAFRRGPFRRGLPICLGAATRTGDRRTLQIIKLDSATLATMLGAPFRFRHGTTPTTVDGNDRLPFATGLGRCQKQICTPGKFRVGLTAPSCWRPWRSGKAPQRRVPAGHGYGLCSCQAGHEKSCPIAATCGKIHLTS